MHDIWQHQALGGGVAAQTPAMFHVNKAKMDDPNSKDSAGAEGGNDRRVQHNLRLIFDNACRITAPFFDPAQSWGGSSLTMYARQTLRETYPELTQQEIAILLSGVARFHKGGAKPSL